jgi:hypothetical protein
MQYKHPFKLLDLIVKERASQRSALSASCLPSWRIMPRYSWFVYLYLTNIASGSICVTHSSFIRQLFTQFCNRYRFPPHRCSRRPLVSSLFLDGNLRNLLTESGDHVALSTVNRRIVKLRLRTTKRLKEFFTANMRIANTRNAMYKPRAVSSPV